MALPLATVVPLDTDPRPALTVLSGFSPSATLAVTRTLLSHDPSLLVVRHDISGVRAGTVHRIVRTGTDVLENQQVNLVHGCTSCTLREDVLPTLVRLARSLPDHDQVLVLPEAVEPQTLAEACASFLVQGAPIADSLRVDSFATVVDAERAMADLSTTDGLIHHEMHAGDDDHRAIASVVARQIEYADTVVLYGQSPGGAAATARLGVLLNRLAPWATHIVAGDRSLAQRLRRTGRHRPHVPGVLARGLEGMAVAEPESLADQKPAADPDPPDPVADAQPVHTAEAVHETEPVHASESVHEVEPGAAPDGVVTVVFRACRPLHPQRLHHAFESLTIDVLRSRGHLWIASLPELVLSWESAGGRVAMGPMGPWLAAMPDDRWEEASEQRRLAAAMQWDPYYGDRNTHLVFVGLGLDQLALERRLTACLLTDDELAMGEDGWRSMPDPFRGMFAAHGHRDIGPERATHKKADTEGSLT